jgi:hypothetical protein
MLPVAAQFFTNPYARRPIELQQFSSRAPDDGSANNAHPLEAKMV